MKFKQLIAVATLAIMLLGCNTGGSQKGVFNTKTDSISYALGSAQTQGMMMQLEQMDVKQYIDTDWFLKGAEDNAKEEKLLDEQSGNAFLQMYLQKLRIDSAFQVPQATKGETLANATDSMSYALGLSLMNGVDRGIEQLKIEGVDKTLSLKGIKDVMTDTALIDEKTGMQLLNDLVREARAKQMQEQQKVNEEKFADNKKAGEDFLAKNANKKGITVTESGLQYEVLVEGKGPKPTTADKVKVHYHGTLIDGTVFDSSVERGEPAKFGVTQVISGWTEALQLMNVGSKYKLYIPQELAYGGRSAGQSIKPFSALIFEVELLEIVE